MQLCNNVTMQRYNDSHIKGPLRLPQRSISTLSSTQHSKNPPNEPSTLHSSRTNHRHYATHNSHRNAVRSRCNRRPNRPARQRRCRQHRGIHHPTTQHKQSQLYRRQLRRMQKAVRDAEPILGERASCTTTSCGIATRCPSGCGGCIVDPYFGGGRCSNK